MKNIPTILPIKCHLWTKETLVPSDFYSLKEVERYRDGSHFIRQLMRCSICGQYYYKEFLEHIDWVGGNDPQYRTYIPIKYDQKVIKRLNALDELDIHRVSPRLLDDWGADDERKIRWIGKDQATHQPKQEVEAPDIGTTDLQEQQLPDQDIVARAEFLARKYHASAVRRGDDSPYIKHPEGVAGMLKAEKFSDTVVAAGWCHDLLEDTNCSEQEIVEACGQEVLEIVQAVTNDDSLPWEEKKIKYIASVKAGPEAAKAVCLMDKIYNLRDLLKAYKKQGPALWQKFNRGKKDKYWFESSVLQMLIETWDHSKLVDYELLVEKMSKLDEKKRFFLISAIFDLFS